jgi:hypothetical protein
MRFPFKLQQCPLFPRSDNTATIERDFPNQGIARMASTLEQLENEIWPEPDVHTSLIDTCHRLRKIPIDSLRAGDIRMLLGQRIGVRHLAPRAIEILNADPMLDASFFPGDLLAAVLSADDNRYRGFPKLRNQLVSIVSRASRSISELEEIPGSLHNLIALLPEYEQ